MENLIKRDIYDSIDNNLFKWKIIIIYGPRQVWKTTIARQFLDKYWDKNSYYNCDEPDVRDAFTNKTSTELKNLVWNSKLIIIDEAQRVENIWITLKLLIDNYPDLKIIATWSSSFELANKINEPLTWRKYEYHLFPFSINELKQIYNNIEINRILEERLIYWSYPVVFDKSKDEKISDLKMLTDSYLFKDIFSFWKIKKPDILVKLLQALALQIWNQVSYNELSKLIWIDKNTVESYISLLEQAFIIFRLNSFSRNLRTELKHSKKIYFYDNGIRNALINNFNETNLRLDTWHLWENFLLSERIKYISNKSLYRNSYFWRNHLQAEIDYIEEYNWELHTFEFKYWNKKQKIPKAFNETYPNSEYTIINKENYLDFLT